MTENFFACAPKFDYISENRGFAKMAHDVFISYSSKDKPTADATCAKLEARGIRCWMAPRDIMPGDDWSSSIIDAINGARAMVLVFSAHANASQQIKREVERAVNKGIPVIPLRIENIAPEKSLEYFISTPHWLDAFTTPLDQHLTYLADVIRHILDGRAVPERPPPPPPPWWRGPAGMALGAAVLLLVAGLAWFSFLRPPPGFVGSWSATALDVRQFTTEDAMLSAEIPPQLLAATLKDPASKGSLTIQPSGQFSLSVDGADHGTIAATPALISGGGNSLTFTSDVTHASMNVGMDLFRESDPNSSGSLYQPATDPTPDGQTLFQLLMMSTGMQNGTAIGTFTGKPTYQGTPDANGNMRTLDIIAGSWQPEQFSYAPGLGGSSSGGVNSLSASLVITADGHYSLSYNLSEQGLWHASNGNWSRQVPTGSYAPPNTDGGTYTFQGRNQVSLFDQFGSSVWQRNP